MAVSSSSSLLLRTLIPAMASATGAPPRPTPHLSLPSKPRRCSLKPTSRRPLRSIHIPSISAVHFEDLVEKDWSFLDPDAADVDRARLADRVIAAAGVGAGEQQLLACFPTPAFVDRLVEAAPGALVLATHQALLVLAEIKERHDPVRCWQGGVEIVPERFSSLDAVFVCYFPAMGVPLEGLLGSLARRCSPGARVVISCEQGREAVEGVHRQQHPDLVTSDLPDRPSLEKAAAEHSFEMIEFVDEPSFYLAVLKFCR